MYTFEKHKLFRQQLQLVEDLQLDDVLVSAVVGSRFHGGGRERSDFRHANGAQLLVEFRLVFLVQRGEDLAEIVLEFSSGGNVQLARFGF